MQGLLPFFLTLFLLMILTNNHIPQYPFQKQLHCTYFSKNIYIPVFMFIYTYCILIFLLNFYKVLVTLRFLAKGDYLSEVADLHGIPLPSASLCLPSVEQQAGQHSFSHITE